MTVNSAIRKKRSLYSPNCLGFGHITFVTNVAGVGYIQEPRQCCDVKSRSDDVTSNMYFEYKRLNLDILVTKSLVFIT